MASQSSLDKVRRYRESMRRQGLRPLQIWVPDIRAPGFDAEARRQSRAVAATREDRAVNDFIERVTDWDD